MQIFNTRTRRKEEIVPLEPGHLRMYSCGPTVYRSVHIGNLRTFVMADWLRRALVHAGFRVAHIKNITDVGHMRVERLDQGEDKVVAQARREGRTSAEIATFYTNAFMHDEQRLGILPADIFPRATDHIAEMIAMIRTLEERGLAYSANGTIYFDVTRFPAYGSLSGNDFEGMLAGVRDTSDPAKRNPEDFALWKTAEPGREMAWESPWGRGFPGWHIECSAMATRYLGTHFDIHTGGVDNIFPHHENEIAQSEGALGAPWVSYWVHAQHLLTDGLKMAKSTSNAYTLDDIIARGFEPLALRYLFTTAHYRSRLNFTFTALAAAQTTLYRLRAAAQHIATERIGVPEPKALSQWQAVFNEALNDDLNLPRAVATIWRLLRGDGTNLNAATKYALLQTWDTVLGLDIFSPPPAAATDLPDAVTRLVATRNMARMRREYVTADRLRTEIEAAGFRIHDTPSSSWVERRSLRDTVRLLANWREGPDRRSAPDRWDWSINLIAQNNYDDLRRCIDSIVRWHGHQSIQILIVDNGSTDETLDYLQDLVRQGQITAPDGTVLAVEVLFADHNLGYAGARNVTTRAAQGRNLVLLDTSIELIGDIWTLLDTTLADPSAGVVGPYGLITTDLREFEEAPGPDVDAIEGYLMAFRRALLIEVNALDEKFRFYRLADIHWSFFFKAAGLRAIALPEVAARLIRHPHREWYSLLPEEQATKSKKNYDLFRARWHHGMSLLVMNNSSTSRWRSHDDQRHIAASHMHTPDELPPPGQPHSHAHRHLSDHEHTHPHFHDSMPRGSVRKANIT